MIDLTLQFSHLDGGTSTARVAPGDLVRFERHYGVRIGELGRALAAGEVALEWLLFLGWRALQRTSATGLDFDAWCDTVADLAAVDGQPARPIQQGPSGGGS